MNILMTKLGHVLHMQNENLVDFQKIASAKTTVTIKFRFKITEQKGIFLAQKQLANHCKNWPSQIFY